MNPIINKGKTMNVLFKGIALGVGFFIGYKSTEKAVPYISKYWNKCIGILSKEENP